MPSLECFCDEDAAAEARGGQRLIGEQFGEGEFERRPPSRPNICPAGTEMEMASTATSAEPPRQRVGLEDCWCTRFAYGSSLSDGRGEAFDRGCSTVLALIGG